METHSGPDHADQLHEQPMDMPPGSMELRFTPELLTEIETELADVESAIETLQLDRVVSR